MIDFFFCNLAKQRNNWQQHEISVKRAIYIQLENSTKNKSKNSDIYTCADGGVKSFVAHFERRKKIKSKTRLESKIAYQISQSLQKHTFVALFIGNIVYVFVFLRSKFFIYFFFFLSLDLFSNQLNSTYEIIRMIMKTYSRYP